MRSPRYRWLSRCALVVLVGASAAAVLGSALWGAVVLALALIIAVGGPATLRASDRWLNAPADPSTTQLDDWGREYAIQAGDLPDAEAHQVEAEEAEAETEERTPRPHQHRAVSGLPHDSVGSGQIRLGETGDGGGR
jgi:hypothetical protein